MKKNTSQWKDTPRSTAEQIEISLRSDNTEKQSRLDSITANCDFILQNSDNIPLKQFAAIVRNIAHQTK